MAGLALALALVWLGGLLWFAGQLPSQVEDPHSPSDGIVVLTGGAVRLAAGFALLDAGKAKQLFISGVHRGTSREHIKRLMAEAPARFECCVDLGKVAENTAGNAAETADWVARRAIQTLRLVTAGYHMPRSLVEFRRVMPEVKLIAHPVFPEHVKLEAWWRWPGTAALLAGEFSKYLVSLMQARISRPDHGLRGAVRPAGKESRAARCGASGKRLDATCRPDDAARRVASRRPPAASKALSVAPLRSSDFSLRIASPGRDAGRDQGEKYGLTRLGGLSGPLATP